MINFEIIKKNKSLSVLGIVWPLEGQPVWMRMITKWLPMTKAIDAMRGLLLKGKTILIYIEINNIFLV
jgi:ABC-type polysaccharide/polyol phosphate export permease